MDKIVEFSVPARPRRRDFISIGAAAAAVVSGLSAMPSSPAIRLVIARSATSPYGAVDGAGPLCERSFCHVDGETGRASVMNAYPVPP